MAQKNIDDLLGLFEQQRNYFDAPVEPLPEVPTMKATRDYESDPAIEKNYTPAIQVGDVPRTSEAKFVNQNYNIMANEAGDQSQELETEANRVRLAQMKKMQEQEEIANEKVSMAKDFIGQERRTPGDYSGLQSRIEKMMDEAEKPQQDDMATQLITAFGPGLMGMALGGSAGYNAAKPAHEFGYALSEQRKKDALASSKSKREAGAYALEALGKLRGEEAKGLAEYDKAGLERAKYMGEIMEKYGANKQEMAKFYSDWAEGKEKDSTEMFKKRLEIGKEGVKTTVEQDQKKNDRDAALQRAKIQKKPGSGMTPGEKKTDEDFAKKYNEWTQGESKTYRESINTLKQVAARMSKSEGGTDGFHRGAARILGPNYIDNVSTADTLKNKTEVKKAALAALKSILGGSALSDRDVINQVESLWNDKDSTQNNVERVNNFINEQELRANALDNKVKYYEKNRKSLRGYDGLADIPTSKSEAPKKEAQSFEKDVIDYAKKHNISNEAAQKIKNSRSK